MIVEFEVSWTVLFLSMIIIFIIALMGSFLLPIIAILYIVRIWRGKMKFVCENCGKKGFRSPREMKWKHKFCCRECYFEYIRKNGSDSKHKRLEKDYSYQQKLKEWAKIYAKRN